ncbi:MAG: hypothetical protein IJB79_07405, partial [Candidatus Gastranaerophilales bacterium]|nr:hypothetical protein [Candidatus Gastranaerophilales bacterium]
YQVSPSSSGTITVDGCEMSKSLLGIITVDINGEEEPNTPYKDQFNFPISSKGIEYEMMCQEEGEGAPAYDCAEVSAFYSSYTGLAFSCDSFGSGWAYQDNDEYGQCNHPCGFTIYLGEDYE